MEALSTKTLELQAGRPRLFYGNYAYYLDRIAREASGDAVYAGTASPDHNAEENQAEKAPLPETEKNAAAETMALPKSILVKAGEQTLLSAAERREQEKQRQSLIRRLERQENEILKELEEMETEKRRLEGELARPEVYSSGEKAKAIKLKLDESAAALELKTREWEAKAEEMEKAKSRE